MDDSKFDNFLKGKLDEYEDPHFDEAALATFQQRRGTATFLPWYQHYRTELIVVSALVVFTLINGWWLLPQEDRRYEALLQKVDSLQTDNRRIYELQRQLSVLKTKFSDTVRYLAMKEERANTALNGGMTDTEVSEVAGKSGTSDNTKTSEAKLVPQLWGREGRPLLTHRPVLTAHSPVVMTSGATPLDVLPFKFPVRTAAAAYEADNTAREVRKRSQPPLSAKVSRELEKHFHRGVGINAGPIGLVSGSLYGAGDSELNLGGGGLIEFVLSPSISVETGAQFVFRNYSVHRQDELNRTSLLSLAPLDGELEEVDINNQMLEFPVHIKYRRALSSKNCGLLGGGYSPLMYTSQDFIFHYAADDTNNASIATLVEKPKVHWYPGTLNAMLGFKRSLENRAALEFSLYYQHALGEAGLEQIRYNTLGLRTVYWFTIK